MWPEAKQICPNDENLKDLIRRQARWAEETGDWQEAADMWVQSGDYMRAITIMGERGWLDPLIDVCRQLNKNEMQAIKTCGQYFRKHGIHQYAKEAYLKINDLKSLMQLHVEMLKWDEAFQLLESHPEYAEEVYLPYAEWLALNDRFDEAQEAFKKANKPLFALRMIEQLAYNGVLERRFKDAGYYFWKLAYENLRIVQANDDGEGGAIPLEESQKKLHKFHEYYRRAELYHAYANIHKYTEIPFTSQDPTNLFHIARYLMMNVRTEVPMGISKLSIVLALAKLGKQLETYKLARHAHDKLQGFVIPKNMMDALDLQSVTIRAKPFQDKEEMLPICYRCSSTNPLLNNNGDVCANCHAPFVRSFHSFDHLPLVEFRMQDPRDDEDALKMIESPNMLQAGRKKEGDDDGWNTQSAGGTQVLTFGAMQTDLNMDDPFSRQLMNLDIQSSKGYTPVLINLTMLKQFKKEDIFVVKWPGNVVKPKFFRNMIPDVAISMCEECNHFFHEEDFEFECLKKGGCPFCGSTKNMPS
eukprot:NODE_1765_length_1818_cov_66.009440_g1496_i0.p1 GENE.NODE_1765_length_1818_cov_66.009440_g1496_i0~~NODE_1765_length_1818_cov_66.009440_g1496_i0.p1  ORF type:complete len:562 (+),score=141.20 NODE_1765_length_1818_cov_66.009440_g1496_i0:104-1687(+)